jgi:ribosomal protein S18 acetylase RimI-like enzyme
MTIREPEHDEFVKMIATAICHEYENYHKHVLESEVYQMESDFPDELWERKCAAYCTEDCSGLCVMTPNTDGSQYMYSLFVKEGHRNAGIGTALARHAMERSPKGVSLHVNSDNAGAQALYKRLGFKPYGMQMPEREIFMATKKGLGGKENW